MRPITLAGARMRLASLAGRAERVASTYLLATALLTRPTGRARARVVNLLPSFPLDIVVVILSATARNHVNASPVETNKLKKKTTV